MNVHQHARMTVHGRLRVQLQKWPVKVAAQAAGISLRTAYKWLARWRAGGEPALHDRSSAPARSPNQVPPESTAEIVRLRRQRLSSPKIARRLVIPCSTVGLVLRRQGLGRLRDLDAKPVPRRYERARPGELIHIDTKKLGKINGIGHRISGDRRGQSAKRGIGWEHLHVAIDDAARLAYSEILPSERKADAVGFLERACSWFARHGVAVKAVMTDNGSAYRSRVFRAACATAGLRHLRTRPDTPRTNGKAERFIQTALREWAYASPYPSSDQRSLAIDPWLHHYNHHRPHAGIQAQTQLND